MLNDYKNKGMLFPLFSFAISHLYELGGRATVGKNSHPCFRLLSVTSMNPFSDQGF